MQTWWGGRRRLASATFAIQDPPTLIFLSVGMTIGVIVAVVALNGLGSSDPVAAPPAPLSSSTPRWVLPDDLGPFPDGDPASPEAPDTSATVEPPLPPTTPAATQSRTPPRAPIATSAPIASSSTITGRYRVMDSFGDSFIGEVLVTNYSGREQDWSVRLVLPDNIGAMRTFWVESAPQATLRRFGQVLLFTSGVPVPARSSVPLRFHLERTGTRSTPLTCTVNNFPCTGL